MSTVRLKVGGLTLALWSRRPSPALQLPLEFRPFLASRGNDISLELREEPPPRLPSSSPLFESGGVWAVHEDGGAWLYVFSTPVHEPPVYKVVRIDRRLRAGTLFFPPSSAIVPRHALDFPLDELLFQHRLAREGALEVHACGVVIDGGAALFLGQSGAGKSTLARLWDERSSALALSDDRIVLRRRGRTFRAHGTPWHGEGGLAAPGSAPLRALFFIRHDPENAVRALAAHQAVSRLVARAFFPPWDRRLVAQVIETSAAVVSTVPCYELGFRADASAVRFVRRVLAGQGTR